MIQCPHCGKGVDTDGDPDSFYSETVSWVTGPKLDHPVMRERTGRVAHKTCVENLVHGQAPDQPELEFNWPDDKSSGCETCDKGLTKPGHRGHAIS